MNEIRHHDTRSIPHGTRAAEVEPQCGRESGGDSPLPGISRLRLGQGILLLWIAAVLAGMSIVLARQNHAGERGVVPTRWPAESRLARAPKGPTLLVFLHPNCPCSKASVHSLQRILGALPESRRPRPIFVLRRAALEDWRARSLIADAGTTPGARLFRDDDEREIRRFGAAVSGHVLLYDSAGRLAFDGGITSERGHEGESVAEDRLRRLLGGTPEPRIHTTVFGCALATPHRPERKGVTPCPTS